MLFFDDGERMPGFLQFDRCAKAAEARANYDDMLACHDVFPPVIFF